MIRSEPGLVGPLARSRLDGPVGTGAAPRGAPATSSAAGCEHGAPVAFGSFGGFLHPAEGAAARGVLMLSPFGYEEMCLRTTWRALADRLARAGLPTLRFDYPGTADAIDPAAAPKNLEDWREAIGRAALHLRRETGCAEIVLLGQGLGAALALTEAGAIPGVEAAVLMAPVVKGRSYLRELQAWTRMLTDRIGIAPDPADASGTCVAGLALAPERAAAIRAIDVTACRLTLAHAVLVERPGHPADAALADHLAACGAAVQRLPYEGYERLMTDPTQADPPVGTLDRIVAAVAGLPPVATPAAMPDAPAPASARLVGDGFDEEPLRFGPGGSLFGIVCRPTGVPVRGAVVLVNAGRDYHVGWGRQTVEQARALALHGFASLRFDAAGIGDSPGAEAAHDVVYSDAQVADVRRAIDLVDSLSLGPITLVGRCSGAYAAFNAAVLDPRAIAVVLVNTERFVWDPDESVAEALRYGHRSIGDFGATLLRRGGLARLLTGRLRVRAAATYVWKRAVRDVGKRLSALGLGGRDREVHRRFRVLAQRGAAISLVFSEGDLGLHEFRTFFGAEGQRLARYPTASVTMAADADHNFTHQAARRTLTGILCRLIAGEDATA